jgi:class 3 adenylate cyclase
MKKPKKALELTKFLFLVLLSFQLSGSQRRDSVSLSPEGRTSVCAAREDCVVSGFVMGESVNATGQSPPFDCQSCPSSASKVGTLLTNYLKNPGAYRRDTAFAMSALVQKQHKLFAKFISPQVRNTIECASGAEELFEGKVFQGAAFFCDVRGFTRICESNEPALVMRFLNEYFSKVIEIISKYGGVVDKIIGDEVFALFLTDDEDEETSFSEKIASSCDCAVASALEVSRMVSGFEFQELNLDAVGGSIENGIGIHSGQMVGGLIGSAERCDFTFIGDVINVASRLQGLNKEFSSELSKNIIVSQEVYDSLSSQYQRMFSFLSHSELRGRQNSITTFGITAATPQPLPWAFRPNMVLSRKSLDAFNSTAVIVPSTLQFPPGTVMRPPTALKRKKEVPFWKKVLCCCRYVECCQSDSDED